MGILAQLEKGLGIINKRPDSHMLLNLAETYGQEAPHPHRWQDLITAYRIHPWTYAAVRAIAMAASDVPIRAYRAPPKLRHASLATYKRIKGISHWSEVIPTLKSEGAEIIDEHPILDLLANPMPDSTITQHELIQATITYLELEGEAYWEKIWEDKGRTRIRGLWPKIDPRFMWAIPGEERLIDGFIYRAGTKPVVFRREDIVPFSYFHPESPYYGLAPTEVLRTAILADVKAVDWNRMFFENDATPGLILETDVALTPQEVEAIEARWQAKHRGVSRAHRMHVFGRGLKPHVIQPSHKDMEFQTMREWSRDEILAAYGVPPLIVGLYKEVNRAAALTMQQLFWTNTVIPRLGKLEAVLNADLISGGEEVRLFFDFSEIEALQEDVVERAQIGQMLLQQGWTPNEVRQFWGKPRGTGEALNTVYIPWNMQPAGRVESPQNIRGQERGAPEKMVVKYEEVFLPNQSSGRKRLSEIARLFLAQLLLMGAERAAIILGEMGMEVPDNWREIYSFRPYIEEWMDTHIPKLANMLEEETNREVLAVIRQGMRDGKGPQAIARDLHEQFEWMSRVRAERIARTETLQAVSTGQYKLFKDTGVEYLKWLHALHGDSRPWHLALHGSIRRIDEGWVTEKGNRMMYPGDPAGGPIENCNCRCAAAPVLAYTFDEDAHLKRWDEWLTKVEDDIGGKFQVEIRNWFRVEEERYVEHFLNVAGEG